jgi:hypothetical protein
MFLSFCHNATKQRYKLLKTNSLRRLTGFSERKVVYVSCILKKSTK